jgi:transaldolase
MPSCSDLKVKLFADGAELSVIARLAEDPLIRGFTTNPTLMRKAGVLDYAAFAREVLAIVPDRPVSFEVFSDDFDEMERQALEIASWGGNVHVKIPVTNTRGESSGALVRRLSAAAVKLNVTAILTSEQVAGVVDSLADGASGFVSVFAGRIADTGRDPIPVMKRSLELLRARPGFQLIWASPRELLNVFQADAIGCHVLTATTDILSKLKLVGKDLDEYSLETVQMFYDDAQSAGYAIQVGEIAGAPGRSS